MPVSSDIDESASQSMMQQTQLAQQQRPLFRAGEEEKKASRRQARRVPGYEEISGSEAASQSVPGSRTATRGQRSAARGGVGLGRAAEQRGSEANDGPTALISSRRTS